MDVFTFVVVVVIVGCATSLATTWIKSRHDAPGRAAPEELEALRRRIEALEEIVTDRSFELKRELDRLEGGD